MGRAAGRRERRYQAGHARTRDPGRSARAPDQLRRWTRDRGRGHRRRPPRPRAAQRGEVILDRVRGAVQVEHRNQDIRKHVAGDENPAFLDQQRRMARGMRLVLDNPDLRAIPGNPRGFGGQAGNEPKQVPRYLRGDVRRYPLGDAGLRSRVRQHISDIGRAAGRAVTRRRAEPGVPEQVIPVRMGRKPCHHRLPQHGWLLPLVVRNRLSRR
jgi:hypothetical protein